MTEYRLLESGDRRLLEDGTSIRLLETLTSLLLGLPFRYREPGVAVFREPSVVVARDPGVVVGVVV